MPMIYIMSSEEKASQLGQLMLDKKASQARLAEFKLKAKNIGKQFETIEKVLAQDPSWYISGSLIATTDEVNTLIEAIRVEQIKLWDYEQDLKSLGF